MHKHLTKKILLVSLKIEDKTINKLAENNLVWTQNAQANLYGQSFANKLTVNQSIDRADEVKLVNNLVPNLWKRLLLIIKFKH